MKRQNIWRGLKTAGLCAGFGLAALPAWAADSKGTYQTLYYIPCTSYIEHRKEPPNTGNNAIAKIYFSGWLTGYNYVTPNTYNILSGMGTDDVLVWMDDYCAKNQDMNVESGLLELTGKAYPNRIQEYIAPVVDDEKDPIIRATSSAAGRNESRFMISRKNATATAAATDAKAKKE